MITLNPDFKDFIQLLNLNKAKYLLVGGYAVALHGYVRYTSDMDIWISTNPENVVNVVEALKEFGLPQSDELLSILQKEKRVIGMGIPPYKIEVITSIDGVLFEECYKNCLRIEIEDVTITYLSLPDLIKNKQASGRHKDLNDLEHLL
jgi:hypothetical protein